jgi:hypothetical protein
MMTKRFMRVSVVLSHRFNQCWDELEIGIGNSRLRRSGIFDIVAFAPYPIPLSVLDCLLVGNKYHRGCLRWWNWLISALLWPIYNYGWSFPSAVLSYGSTNSLFYVPLATPKPAFGVASFIRNNSANFDLGCDKKSSTAYWSTNTMGGPFTC